MAELKAFKALRYTPKAGEISTLVCPPYDIISEEERKELIAKNEYNAINLEYCRDGNDIYDKAAQNLKDWQSQGIVECDNDESFYIYEEEFTVDGMPNKIKGIIGLLRLEEFSKGVVLPHEETLDTPKEDRFKLMKATACNFSSIYMMYHDKEDKIFNKIDELSQRLPDQTFKTEDGIKHNIWFVKEQDDIKDIEDLLGEKQLYIADGHHRYTTMINYRDYLKDKGVIKDKDHPANFGLVTLMNIENPGLVVFPTHRVIKNLAGFDLQQLLTKAEEYFDIYDMPKTEAEKEINRLAAEDKIAFVLYTKDQAKILALKNKDVMVDILPDMSDAYRQLDVAVLHTLLLERLLRIDKENLANQTNLIYTRSSGEAFSLVDSGQVNCAFLINATSVGQIADVSDAGEKMPQKSTYFYPKLITGHVMNKIMDI